MRELSKMVKTKPRAAKTKAAQKTAGQSVKSLQKKAKKAHAHAVANPNAHNLKKAERRAHKLQTRKQEAGKKEKRIPPGIDWNGPAPSHLVGRLDVPRISTKHQTYFEFADNLEKKKKLEFKV